MDFSQWQKRISSVITLTALLLTIFTGRLYQKTVVEHGEIAREANSQYVYRKEVTGQRGSILVKLSEQNYYPLAANERRYQVIAVPNHIKDSDTVAKKLAPLIGAKEGDLKKKIGDKKRFYVPPLARRLSRQQADAIAALQLRGIELFPESIRTYPEGQLAAQVVGFVNNEGKGNYGIEGTLDSVLKGGKGFQEGEKDSLKRLITVTKELKAKDGVTVVLSLDREIQHFVEKALADAVKEFQADSGSVVIVQPKTGAIVAMASLPTYNPNAFNQVTEPAAFMNPVTSNVWEPGSIFKPLIMALAIDKGLVQPDTQETFGASVRVLNHDIYTAEKKAFGRQTMTQVLENSDNVGMVWVSNKLGNQGEFDGLKKFGFGTPPSFNLSNLTGGSVPVIKQWNDLTRATISFGQGVSVSPLQMVMAYSALANNGVLLQPYIVDDVLDANQNSITKAAPKQVGRVVSEETSKKIGNMLEAVVINGHGKRAQVEGYRIGGKTGTAQIPNPEGGYFDDRFIGSFAGYFPISNPEYAMVVKLDNPKTVKFAESSAGPTFGKIASWVLTYKQVKKDKN
jgi:cell division protein FtsI/penicillin-binding protein 2